MLWLLLDVFSLSSSSKMMSKSDVIFMNSWTKFLAQSRLAKLLVRQS